MLIMNHANFTIVNSDEAQVTIQDMGPWERHPTITNDAEWVVEQMNVSILRGRRLFYIDSEGTKDELIHKDGKFVRFAPGPR